MSLTLLAFALASLYPTIHFDPSFAMTERYNTEMMINNIAYHYYLANPANFANAWSVTVKPANECSLRHEVLGSESNGTEITLCIPHGVPTPFIAQGYGNIASHEIAHLIVYQRTHDYRLANNLIHYAQNLALQLDFRYIHVEHGPYMDNIAIGVQYWDIDKLIGDGELIMLECQTVPGQNAYV